MIDSVFSGVPNMPALYNYSLITTYNTQNTPKNYGTNLVCEFMLYNITYTLFTSADTKLSLITLPRGKYYYARVTPTRRAYT